MTTSQDRAARAEFVPPNDGLKRKTLNFETGLGLSLTEDEIEKIAVVIERSADIFVSGVGQKLKALRSAIATLDLRNPARLNVFLNNARTEAYDIGSMGGTFGYPLMTLVAKSLSEFLERKRPLGRNQLTVIGLHVNMLYVILAQKLKVVDVALEDDVASAFYKLTQKVR